MGGVDGLVIRHAELADLGAVRDVFRRSSLSNRADRADLLAHPEVLDLSDQAIREGRTRVAVVDDHVIGFVTTAPSDDGLELEDLFVDPDWTRRGIGRALVSDAAATARERGVIRIEVTANEHALDFYETVGFVQDDMVTTQFGSAPRMHLDVR